MGRLARALAIGGVIGALFGLFVGSGGLIFVGIILIAVGIFGDRM